MASFKFETQVAVLADVWMNFRNVPEHEDFMYYNDLGLPLAYMLHSKMIEGNDSTKSIIEESFHMALEDFFGYTEDMIDDLTDEEVLGDLSDLISVTKGSMVEKRRYAAMGAAELMRRGREDEQNRVQAICNRKMDIAEENNQGDEYLFWKRARWALRPIANEDNE